MVATLENFRETIVFYKLKIMQNSMPQAISVGIEITTSDMRLGSSLSIRPNISMDEV